MVRRIRFLCILQLLAVVLHSCGEGASVRKDGSVRLPEAILLPDDCVEPYRYDAEHRIQRQVMPYLLYEDPFMPRLLYADSLPG